MCLIKIRSVLPYREVLEVFEKKMSEYLEEAMTHFPTRNLIPHERLWRHRVSQQRLFKETKREILFKFIKKEYCLSEKEYRRLKRALIGDSAEKLMRVWAKCKK